MDKHLIINDVKYKMFKIRFQVFSELYMRILWGIVIIEFIDLFIYLFLMTIINNFNLIHSLIIVILNLLLSIFVVCIQKQYVKKSEEYKEIQSLIDKELSLLIDFDDLKEEEQVIKFNKLAETKIPEKF